MKVYTYFHPIPAMDVYREHRLILCWQQSWRRCGWEPVVLTHQVAESHKRFKEYDALVRSWPTVNPPGYDLACYHRWLALSVVGGGISTDYDVIARNFDSELLALPNEVTVLDRGGTPCAVYAIGGGPEAIVDSFFTMPPTIVEVNGKPHTSDMYHMQNCGWVRAPHHTCPFGESEWLTAPAVHFSHSDCGKTRPGVERSKIIREVMGL
jgi:hypothetical protein